MATGIRQIWREVTLTYPSLPFYLSFSYPSHTFASQSSSSVRFLYTMHPKGNFLFAGYTRHTIPCFATTASHMGDICILRPYTYAFGTGCFAFFFFPGSSWDIVIGALASEIWFASPFSIAMQLSVFFSHSVAKKKKGCVGEFIRFISAGWLVS